MFKIILVSQELLDPLIKQITRGLLLTHCPDVLHEAVRIKLADVNMYLEALLLDSDVDCVDQEIIDSCQDVLSAVKTVLTTTLEINPITIDFITFIPHLRTVAFHTEID